MKFNKILCAGTALLLAGSLGGCSMKFGTKTEPKPEAVIAEPTNGGDDSMKITYEDFKKEYTYVLKGEGIEDDTAESVAESCKSDRNTIITYLINERIIMKKAAELGISTLTEEEMNAVEEDYNSHIEEQIEAFGEDADYGTADPETITDEQKRERGSKEFDEYLAGCNMTRDDLLKWQISSAVTQKLIAEVGKSVEYSAAEESFLGYEEQVKQLYNDSLSEYEQGGFTSVWVPEGARMIKHILLGFDEETQDDITANRQKGDDEAADKIRAEKAAELQDKVDEVQKKLDDGEDFQKLVLEYSNDAAASSMYPDGYVVIPNGVAYMEEFQEAAFVPEKIGDRTVCVTDYGVHIMIYADDAKVSDEQKKSFTDYIYEQMKSTEFNKKMSEWNTEYAYKIDYDALRIDDPADSST
ncbi:MAG: hypothetical protein HDT43_09710 [Ruminococcaceae bacterium]|nr:hypothetical protein [Oscillospiraceae bacterium]